MENRNVETMIYSLMMAMVPRELVALLKDEGKGWEIRRVAAAEGVVAEPVPNLVSWAKAASAQLRMALEGDGTGEALPPVPQPDTPRVSKPKQQRVDITRRWRTKSPRRVSAAAAALLKYFSASTGQLGCRVLDLGELERIGRDCGLRKNCSVRALRILSEHYRVVGVGDTAVVIRAPQDAIQRAAAEFPAATRAELSRMTYTSWDTVNRALEDPQTDRPSPAPEVA